MRFVPVTRDEAAALDAGFLLPVEVPMTTATTRTTATKATATMAMKTVALEFTGTGWTTTFQDLGRRDTERRGVPTGGAADQHSAAVANLLVGNPRCATLIENLGGELALVPDADVLLAVTGAPARVTVGGAPVETWTPLVVPKGHEVRVHADVGRGTRTYLAVNGTLAAETLLGSAAPDARMGFGQLVTRGSRVLLDTEFRGSGVDCSSRRCSGCPSPSRVSTKGPGSSMSSRAMGSTRSPASAR